MATSPSGYGQHYTVDTPRGDCQIGVGLDQNQGNVDRFLVQLQYMYKFLPTSWTGIARIDHNPGDPTGHDLYNEGLHVDIVRQGQPDVTLYPKHPSLPQNEGKLIRNCVEYFRATPRYFVEIYRGRMKPGNPPSWP